MWIYKCPNKTGYNKCKKIIKYKSIYTLKKALKENRHCSACRGKMSAKKGIETKRKTGNWGTDTKRKNGTLKCTQITKDNISKGLKKIHSSGFEVWNKGIKKSEDDRLNGNTKAKGKLNPNYKKGYYKWWVEKYGKNIADEKNLKLSYIKSKSKLTFEQWIKRDFTEFNEYKKEVIRITKNQPLHLLENYHKRGRKYHLDHILSIKFGFDNQIHPNIIGHIKNLRIISSRDNLTKNKYLEMDFYYKYGWLNRYTHTKDIPKLERKNK